MICTVDHGPCSSQSTLESRDDTVRKALNFPEMLSPSDYSSRLPNTAHLLKKPYQL